MPIRTVFGPMLFLIIAFLSPGSAASTLTQAAGEEPRLASITLTPPDVELGELFQDDDYGFALRLPRGMSLLPAAQLETLRKQLIAPEHMRMDGEGNVGQVQVFKFENNAGANIYLRTNEPALNIKSPTHLRKFISEGDRRQGRPVEDHGKLYEFSGQGGNVGFLVTRDFGLRPGSRPTHRQHVAYIRSPRRSYVVQYTSPIASFDDLEEQFKAAMCTFAAFTTEEDAAVSLSEAKTSEGVSSGRSIFNLVLAVLLAIGAYALFRKRGA